MHRRPATRRTRGRCCCYCRRRTRGRRSPTCPRARDRRLSQVRRLQAEHLRAAATRGAHGAQEDLGWRSVDGRGGRDARTRTRRRPRQARTEQRRAKERACGSRGRRRGATAAKLRHAREARTAGAWWRLQQLHDVHVALLLGKRECALAFLRCAVRAARGARRARARPCSARAHAAARSRERQPLARARGCTRVRMSRRAPLASRALTASWWPFCAA